MFIILSVLFGVTCVKFVDYLSAYSDDADMYFLDKGNSIRDYSAAIMRDLTDDQVR